MVQQPSEYNPIHQRYFAALHAMQTGVAYRMQKDAYDTQPKHLRVGINSNAISVAALALLLMKKGVITSEEYDEALAEQAEAEAERYRVIISRLYGANITLG